MATKIIIIFLFLVSLGSIFVLYAFKMAFHFMYLRSKDKKKQGTTSDFFYRDFNDNKDAERWKQSWMLYPLLFPIVLDDEKPELNDIKRKIKRMNLSIYAVLIVALMVVFTAAKLFPEGIL